MPVTGTTAGPAPLRVLHVINQVVGHGGAEVSLNQMLVHLQALGVQNLLVGLKDERDSDVVAELESAGVRVLPPLATMGPAAVGRLARVIRRERPSLVHTSLFHSDLWGRLAAKATRTPVVTSIVNTQYDEAAYQAALSPRRLRIVQGVDGLLARRFTTALHAISETTADAAAESLGVPRSAFHVVRRGRPLPVEDARTPEARSTARARAGLPGEGRMILNIGRCEPQKGHVDLLAAFALVRTSVPDAFLVIAGRPGTASPDVDHLVRRLDLRDRVLLLGARSDVPDLLAAADVFAFASRWEGLGGAVLEAMAHRVPVVAFDIPAVREASGGMAALVPPGDTDAMADALCRALLQDDREDGETASARFVAARHDPLAVAAEMSALYRLVAGSS